MTSVVFRDFKISFSEIAPWGYMRGKIEITFIYFLRKEEKLLKTVVQITGDRQTG